MRHRLSFLIAALVLLGLALSPVLASGASIPRDTRSFNPLPQKAATEILPSGPFVTRIYYEQLEDYGRLAGFDVFEYNNTGEKYWLAAVDAEGYRKLQALGFRVEVDEQETINFARLFTPLAQQGDWIETEGVGIETIPSYPCYRTVEETYAAAQALAAARPDLATWTDVGDSWEKSVGQPDGYDMMVLKLTNAAVPGPKPKLFATAAIHAREYTTAELATRFAEYLVNNYDVDPDATWILDHHEVHLMLHTNPDGRKEAESGLSWRKNTNENYCGVTSTSRGADLNRNFSFYWNYCSGCSSGNPCDATYRGPSAGSEPETQAVQNYLLSVFPDQRDDPLTSAAPADATGVYIDLHSYSQLVLWPWGMTATDAPNGTALQTLGRKFAYFNSYTPQQSYDLYGTDGSTTEFAYGNLGVAAYTFELGTAFFQACSTFESTIYPTNLNALIYAAKVVRTPYLTPAGPDALSLAVSPASVASGAPATLTATINDTRYRQTNGTEPTQTIAAAEYYVDTPPWLGGTAYAMAASDGSFSATTEKVIATVNTAGLANGRHMIFVRGQDAAGNWGAFSAAFLDVTPCVAPESVTNLAITRLDSTQVEIEWSASAGAAQYEVWSAASEPYFTLTPGATCSDPAPYTCKTESGTSTTDASLGSPATHTVYVVRAVSSCGAVSEFGSGRVGEFEYSLVRGD